MFSGPHMHSEFLANLYDDVLGDGGIECIPKLLLQAIQGQSAVISRSMSPHGGMTGATHGLPDDTFERYTTYYHSVDPWLLTAADKLAPMTALRGTELISRRAFANTEFCTDFAREIGTVQALGGYLAIADVGVYSFSIHRQASTSEFTEADEAQLQWCMPHLNRVLQLHARLGGNAAFGLAFAALDALAFGAIVCDAHGMIRFCNAAASIAAALHQGVVLGGWGTGLKTLLPHEGGQLASLVCDSCKGGSGGGMTITGRDGAKLLALVVPLPQERGELPPLSLVTFRLAEAVPDASHALLGSAFSLTPAESRLVGEIVDGTPLPQIAAERGLSENTLRTQVASILAKTGTRNQKDLIRLIGILPQVR